MSELAQHVTAANQTPDEATGWASVADHLRERGEPGDELKADIVALHHEAVAVDPDKQRSVHDLAHVAGGIPFERIYTPHSLDHGITVHIRRSHVTRNWQPLWVNTETRLEPPIDITAFPEAVIEHHIVPGANRTFTGVDKDTAAKILHTQVPSAVHLARPVINRKGNEPGINMWTGNETPKDKNAKPPIKAQLIPEHHPADGLVFSGVHPGTNNVHPDANPAWYERSAVHRAMEEAAPGQQFGQSQVTTHIAAIRKLAESEQGKRLLGPLWEEYTNRAAPALKSVVGKGDGLIHGSGRDSRPTGPVMDRLTAVVSPFVKLANRVLHHAGQAQLLGAKTENTRVKEPKGPAYTVLPEHQQHEPTAAENIVPLPTPASAMRALKQVSDAKIEQIKTRAGKEAAKDKQAALAKQNEEKPIPLVSSARPFGWKPPDEHRYDTIKRLLASGISHDAIRKHLTDPTGHALSPRQAAASVRSFIQVEKARRHAAAKAESETPTKLARPSVGAALNPSNLTGMVGTPGKDKPKRIDPQIAGTALAYHLRQIADDFSDAGHESQNYGTGHVRDLPGYDKAGNERVRQLAEHALAGTAPKGVNGDAFAALGDELRARGHPLASTYNWKRVSEGLGRDRWLEHFITQHVVPHPKDEGRQDLFFDRVHRALRNWKTDPTGRALWERLHKHIAAAGPSTYLFDTPTKRSGQSILDSIHRIADRHLDRAYLKAVSKERKHVDDNDPNHWRNVMENTRARKGEEATTGHLKFERHEQKSWNWVSEKIKKLMSEGKPHQQAIAIALSMAGRSNK